MGGDGSPFSSSSRQYPVEDGEANDRTIEPYSITKFRSRATKNCDSCRPRRLDVLGLSGRLNSPEYLQLIIEGQKQQRHMYEKGVMVISGNNIIHG